MFKRTLTACILAAAFASACVPAFADRDAVSFFSNVQIPPNASVHDAVCFFCNVDAQGDVRGNIVVFFGSIHLSGRADHDVVNFFGSVSAADNAQIGNNLDTFFGMTRLGENVTVKKDLVVMFGVLQAPESVIVGHNRVGIPALVFFGPMILIGMAAFVSVSQYRAYRRRQMFEGYPPPPNF